VRCESVSITSRNDSLAEKKKFAIQKNGDVLKER